MHHTLLSSRIALTATLCLGFVLTACDGSSHPNTPPNTLVILPVDCALPISGTAGFSINGALTNNSTITWSARLGLITKDPNGYSANYIAPTVTGQDVITAVVSPGPSGQTETLDRVCTIGSGGPPQNTFPPNPSKSAHPSIAISEVMANSCGGDSYKRFNQYVELYNYGDEPINVNGWFLFDEGESGTPDQLVPWVSRSSYQFSQQFTLNSTVIPPRGFALILSSSYPDAPLEHRMPYPIMPGTVILTVASGYGIGDDLFNIIGSQDGYDTLTLYIGSLTVIDLLVDTYGTPRINGPHPQDIDDDFMDAFPHYMSECHSMERIDPRQPDSASNWTDVNGGTPGDGPYQ